MAPFIASAQTKALDSARKVAGDVGLQTGTNLLPALIGQFIAVALGLLGVVLIVLIIYAGYLYLTAAGDDDKVESAKKILKNAIIGLVIALSAYAITSFVIGEVTGSQKASDPCPGGTMTANGCILDPWQP